MSIYRPIPSISHSRCNKEDTPKIAGDIGRVGDIRCTTLVSVTKLLLVSIVCGQVQPATLPRLHDLGSNIDAGVSLVPQSP